MDTPKRIQHDSQANGHSMARAVRDPKIRLPILFLFLLMLLSSFQRLAVLIAMKERFTAVPVKDLIKSIVIGWRFDLVTACSLSIPLVAALIFSWPKLLARPWVRNGVIGYCSAVISLVTFACIADFYFFKEFDHRLGHEVVEYLRYDYIYRIIWDDYPIIPALLLTLAVFIVSAKIFKRFYFAPRDNFSLWRSICWPLIIIPLLFLGIRSSLGPKAINCGPAYFSNSMSLAQLTLNGLFTLREALDSRIFHHDALSHYVELIPEEEAVALTIETVRRQEDKFLNDPDNPLRRVTDTGNPENNYNVVLVIMESLSWHYVGAMGGRDGLTPNLDELAAHGILMDRCFAVGSRTPYGFSGILCGFPDLPGRSVTIRIDSEGNFLTLGHVLERRGYDTMFIYGGSHLYDHRLAFLRSNGFRSFIFKDDFNSSTFRTHLGWCDEDLFNQAHETFVSMRQRPFLAVLLTLSFHRPYEIPQGRVKCIDPMEKDSDELTCVRYTDWAIGQFIRNAKRTEYFDKTIFVFVADHTGGPSGHPISPVSYRIPFIIYAPAILGNDGRRVSTVCSQTDVVPTIMSILGGKYEHCFFGSDVLTRSKDKGMAMMQHSGKAIAFMDSNQDVLIVPFGGKIRTFHYTAPGSLNPKDGNDAKIVEYQRKLKRKAIAMLETAELLYRRGSYNIHSQNH